MRNPSLLPALVLSSLATAQYISPAYHATAESPGSNTFPFGVTTVPFRYLQVHDDVPVMLIASLSFRHNNALSTIAPAHTVTCDMFASTAVVTSATISTTFDNNHGTDKKHVVVNKAINLPASDPSNVPGAFVLKYPFDVPFVYPGGASLAWEAQITAKTQTANVTYDAPSGAGANPALQYGRAGTGCLATGETAVMQLTGLSNMTWSTNTGRMIVSITNGPASAAFYHVIGFDKTNWNGLPLPYLLPNTSTAPSGPCYLYTDVYFYLTGTLSTGGASTSPVTIPAFPYLNGLAIYNQVYALDATANPSWGFVTSPLLVAGMVAPTPAAPMARVAANGNLGATGGIGSAGTPGLVTRFN